MTNVKQSTDKASDVARALQSDDLARRLALADMDGVQQLVSTALAEIDPSLRLASVGQRGEGEEREILVAWQEDEGTDPQDVVIRVSPAA